MIADQAVSVEVVFRRSFQQDLSRLKRMTEAGEL
jgi:hypothetical protein